MSNIRRARPLTGLLLAVPLALAACSSSAGGDSAGAAEAQTAAAAGGSEELIPVTVGALPIVPTAALLYGVDNGIFEEHGLDVTLETGAGAENFVAALVAGEFDFASVNTVSVMVALDKDVPITVTSGYSQAWSDADGEDISAVLAKPASGITRPADLEGRTVALNQVNSAGMLSIREAVRLDGGDPDAVKFVEIKFPNAIAALESGDVDAIWEVEPFITIAQRGGAEVVSWNFLEASPGVSTQIMVAEAGVDPALVEQFTTALTDVLEQAEGDAEGTRQSLVNLLEMDTALAKSARMEHFTTAINVDAVARFAELALEEKFIDEAVDMSAFPAAPE
ncbi:ABC transporter substrate-binding protein [Georgenia sp. SYP-B2076]|uniref:ABC transporter substrate-binding protein n=1 Tax=Georgenia sp. SYP-B2076 TaxID=2495881 RepID=UPI0013E0DF78|nr:ABC transporter substrate-binding protein [Georgenia sp. SYP-B2076]